MQEQSNAVEEQSNQASTMPSWARRSVEIINVFAEHNFYVNGFTPRELRTTLEDLGPTYVKIGQIMSSRTDMLPKTYCEELELLRSSVAPLDAETARAVIEQETGKRIEDLYQEFHGDPHQGNIMLSKGVPYWIDFGMMGRIDEQSAAVFQDVILALVTKDVEALTNAALSLGKPMGKVNRPKLMDDIDAMISRYGSSRNLNDIDLGALMTELTDLLAEHKIAVPGEYTMLVRSLATFEGVIESLCPELDLMTFLSEKMIARMQKDTDVMEQLSSALEAVASTGLRTARLPGLASDALNSLVKGRLKMVMEPAGLDEPLGRLNEILIGVVLAVFACVLFMGSTLMCLAPIEPQMNGIPPVSFVGFVAAVSLGIYALKRMMQRK